MDSTPRFGLLAATRDRLRTRHMSLRTEKAYLHWIRRYVEFHGRVSPRALGAADLEKFLTHLATHSHVAASTQNQALSALLFMYREVLKIELPWLDNVVRSTRPKHLPVVLSRDEVRRVLAELSGTPWLIASLLYGSGLRVLECLKLRVKDVDLERHELVVRDGKGQKDRVTTLPESLRDPLQGHFARLRVWFTNERRLRRPGVSVPFALARKYPGAPTDWPWQYVFPAATSCNDPYTGNPVRHHLHPSVMQRAVRTAIRKARILKPASPDFSHERGASGR
jgi:integron integrase